MNTQEQNIFTDNGKISKIINSIESSANQKSYWKSLEQIAEMNGISIKEAKKIIWDDINDFARNSFGRYTTRRMYKKYTPITQKIIDAYIGRIQ